jgi:hypothetical protein
MYRRDFTLGIGIMYEAWRIGKFQALAAFYFWSANVGPGCIGIGMISHTMLVDSLHAYIILSLSGSNNEQTQLNKRIISSILIQTR